MSGDQIPSRAGKGIKCPGRGMLKLRFDWYINDRAVIKKKWSEKMSTERFKNVTSFVINLLNNKTIILLNLAEYRLILADSAYGLVG